MTKDKPAAPGRKPRQLKPKNDAKKPEAAPEVISVDEESADAEESVKKGPAAPKSPVKTKSPEPKKDAPAAEILSPVSKLELAREQAAKAQQDRIAQATARRVDEARRKSLKRKEIESDITMPEKVPKIRPEEAHEEINSTNMVHVIESTTVMHTTSTLTHRRPLKKIEQNEGESATAYALRAAKIRKEERKHTEEEHIVTEVHEEQPEAENQPPTAYELKQKGADNVDNIYQAPVEFVNNVTKNPVTRSVKEVEVVEEVDSTATSTRFYVNLSILLVVVFAVLLGLTEVYVSQLPFCDTVSESVSNCKFCPENGICANGVLESCTEPFVALDDICVHTNAIKRDSNQMVTMINSIKSQVATDAFCGSSLVDRISQIDVTVPVQSISTAELTLNADEVESQLRNNTVWEKIRDRTYGMIFKKALEKLNVSTASIPVSLDDASVICQFTTYTIQYSTILFSIGILVVGILFVYVDQKQAEEDAQLLEKMQAAVHEELISQSSKDVKQYASAHLKNHVLDVLKLTKAEKARVDSVLWSRLVSTIGNNPSVRVTEAEDGTALWEWVVVSEPLVGAVPVQVA